MTDDEAHALLQNLLHKYWDKGYSAGAQSVLNEVIELVSSRIQNCSMRGDIALSDLLRDLKDINNGN